MKERASILILAIALSLLLSAISISLLSLITVRYHNFNATLEEIQNRYELSGVLQFASQLLLKARHQNDKISLLPSSSFSPETEQNLLSIEDVAVTVRKVSNDCYELTARKKGFNTKYKLWFKERSIPKNFVLMVFDDTLNLSDSKYKGAVFALKDINIVPSSEREFTHPLLSGGKFIFSSLSAAKTEFKKGYSELFPISPRPPQNYIERIKKEIPLPEKSIKLNGANISLTSQAILVSPEPNIQISITLKGTEILLSTDAKNGSSVTLNIPDDGLVLVEGNLSISGTIKKRLTIVSSGTIRITGDILYLDKNDNHPFLPDFESNSSYSGDSSLALVAVSDILYQPVLPSQSDSSGLKVCALLISLNGSIRSEMSTRMAHLLIYGSRICRKRPYRLIKGTGFADATYLLDPKLAANPPRFAPSFSVPSILCIKVEN